MRKLMAMCVLFFPLMAGAQVQVDIHFPAPPPLVVVSPGVRVVEDYDDEVYFVDNWYWVRRENFWYRTRDHRGGWVAVQPGFVPGSIVRLPPGQYKKFKGEKKFKGREQKWAAPAGAPFGSGFERRDEDRGEEGRGEGHGKGHGNGGGKHKGK